MRPGLALPPHRRVFAAFFVYAFSFGGFFPRLAELQRSMDIGEADLGLGLIGLASGTLLSLTFSGAVVERVGHRAALLTLLPAIPLFVAIAAHAAGPLALFLSLLPAGLCIGAVELVVNLEADRVEHREGRRLMNRAHAFWSFGFFGASALAAALARLGVPPAWHLAAVVPLTAVAVALALRGFVAAPSRSGAHAGTTHRHARPTKAIAALVLFSVSGLLLEGAAIDWSAIYLRDVFAVAPSTGAMAVAIAALAQGATRFVADRAVERRSPVAVARALLAVTGVGAATVALAPSTAVALAGFALIGAGTSVMFPLAMSAAAQLTDRPAATNVAALAQSAFVVFLLAPPLLGFVAEHVGIRWSFGVGVPLVLLSLVVSSSVGVASGGGRPKPAAGTDAPR